jgi:molecular chaperone DnaJ
VPFFLTEQPPKTSYRLFLRAMQVKDYYKTLNIKPSASLQEVKQAFRKLALLHHPDRNAGNAVSEAIFKEIQEAYQVLSDAKSREDYNYKRWYTRSLGHIYKEEALTPEAILHQCERAASYVNSINALQIEWDGLSQHLRQLLNEQNIGILKQYNNTAINAAVTEKILQCMVPLPVRYLPPIAMLLNNLANGNTALQQQIDYFLKQQQLLHNWQRWRLALVIFITAFLCWVIFKISA